jgi:phosphate-selective porin OprO/OprP
MLRQLTQLLAITAALLATTTTRAEDVATAPPAGSELTVGSDGISLRSADGAWRLDLRGYIHADGRFVGNEEGRPVNDNFLIRRGRPILDGTFAGRFNFRLMPDFGDGRTVLQDAYVDARFRPSFCLRVGKFKSPVGLERLQSATAIAFAERALPTNLAPNRDVGLQVHGEFAAGKVQYAIGVFNGVSDGSSADSDNDESKDVAARVWLRPVESGRASGLGVGIAATAGSQRGTLATSGLASYRSASQQSFFAWRTGTTTATTVLADGDRTRIAPQAWFYAGPLGLMAEYTRSKHEVTLDTEHSSIDASAWQATATWLFTGEKASYRGVVPQRPIEGKPGGVGAWELALRVGQFRIDDGAFPIFADPARSASKATEAAIGLNVHLNRNVKAVIDLFRTRFTGGSENGDRPAETVLITRAQIAFLSMACGRERGRSDS